MKYNGIIKSLSKIVSRLELYEERQGKAILENDRMIDALKADRKERINEVQKANKCASKIREIID